MELFQPSLVIGPSGLQISYTALDTAGQGSLLEPVLELSSGSSAQHTRACFRLAGGAVLVAGCCRVEQGVQACAERSLGWHAWLHGCARVWRPVCKILQYVCGRALAAGCWRLS